MRELTPEIIELINSDSYKASYRVWVEDAEGYMVNVSSLEGYDWVENISFGNDLDSFVKEGTLTLYRNYYYLSLAPTVERSKINRDSTGEIFVPLLELSRKLYIDFAIVDEGATVTSGDYERWFEGEIQDIDWSGNEALISVSFHCMMARVRDAYLQTQNDYGGIGLLYQSVNAGDTSATVLYENDLNLASDSPIADRKERVWRRDKRHDADPGSFGRRSTTFTTEIGDKIEWRIFDDTGWFSSTAYLERPDGSYEVTEGDIPSGKYILRGTVYITANNAGTWKLYARAGLSAGVRIRAVVYKSVHPVVQLGMDAVISEISLETSSPTMETVTITDVQRITSEESDEHVYQLNFQDPVDNNYPAVAADRTTGGYVGVEIESVMGQILNEVEFGYGDWSIDLYEEHHPDFVINITELGHQGALDALRTLADQMGWTLDYRWWNNPGEFRLTLRDPERDRITRFVGEENDTFTGSVVNITHIDYLEVGDNLCFLEGHLFEEKVITDITLNEEEELYEVTLDSPLVNEYSIDALVANHDYVVPADNIIEVTQLKTDKSLIRNAIKAGYQKNPLKEPESDDDLGEVQVIDETSKDIYGYLYMEITQKATPNVAGERFARRVAQYALDDLAFPKVDQEVEIRLMPYVQEGDILVFEPDGEHYDSHQVFATVGYDHDSDGFTRIRTRGKPAGGYRKWHDMDVRPGGAPAERFMEPIANLQIVVSYEVNSENEVLIPTQYKIQISWQEPINEYSYFEVRYKKPEDDQWTVESTDTVGYKISNLDPSTQYMIGVRVISSQGGEDATVRRSAWTEDTIDLDAVEPENVTDVTLDIYNKELKDGTVVSVIDVQWVPPSRESYSHGIVYFRELGDALWGSAGTAYDHLVFNPNMQGTTVEIAVLAVNWTGEIFPINQATTHTIEVGGKVLPPSNVDATTISYTFRDDLSMSWDAIPDSDLALYEVRTLDGNWGLDSSDLIYRGRSNSFVIKNFYDVVGSRNQILYIKAKNNSGIFSELAAQITVEEDRPDAPTLFSENHNREITITLNPVSFGSLGGYEVRTENADWGEDTASLAYRGDSTQVTFENPQDNPLNMLDPRYVTVYVKAFSTSDYYSENALTINSNNPEPIAPPIPDLLGFFQSVRIDVNRVDPHDPTVTGYVLYIQEEGEAEESYDVGTTRRNTHETSPGTEVTVRVAAYDVHGEGNKSVTQTVTTKRIENIADFASDLRPVQIVDTLPSLPDDEYPKGASVYLTQDDGEHEGDKLYTSTGTEWEGLDVDFDMDDIPEDHQFIITVDTLPNLPSDDYPQGAVVFLTTDDKLYRSKGSEWTEKIDTGDLAGEIQTDQIAANAITTGKIDAGAVTASEIAANTITASEISGNTITGNEIAGNTITANEISSNTITAGEISAGAIGADEIAANAIIADHIGTNEIIANVANIQEGLIETAHINEIQGDKIVGSVIQSTNWSTTEGSQYNLDNGKFYLGGSENPNLSWDGLALTVSGNIEIGDDYWKNNGDFRLGGLDGITFDGTTLEVGSDTIFSGSIELDNDYWKENGDFRLGGADGITFDGNTLEIGSDAYFAGELQAATGSFSDGVVSIDSTGVDITDGGLTVSNIGGTTIIDGESDMFRIYMAGSVYVADDSVDVYHDLGYTHAFITYVQGGLASSRHMVGDREYRSCYADSDKIRFINDMSFVGSFFHYFILEQEAI